MDLLNVLHSAQTKCTDCKAVFTPNVSFARIDAFKSVQNPFEFWL